MLAGGRGRLPLFRRCRGTRVHRRSLASMRRLSEAQYRRGIADIFGAEHQGRGTFRPGSAPRRPSRGRQLAGRTLPRPGDSEQYYNLARDILAQVTDEHHRQSLPCKPEGRRRSRRRLYTDDRSRQFGLAALPPAAYRGTPVRTGHGCAENGGKNTGDFYAGLRMAPGGYAGLAGLPVPRRRGRGAGRPIREPARPRRLLQGCAAQLFPMECRNPTPSCSTPRRGAPSTAEAGSVRTGRPAARLAQAGRRRAGILHGFPGLRRIRPLGKGRCNLSRLQSQGGSRRQRTDAEDDRRPAGCPAGRLPRPVHQSRDVHDAPAGHDLRRSGRKPHRLGPVPLPRRATRAAGCWNRSASPPCTRIRDEAHRPYAAKPSASCCCASGFPRRPTTSTSRSCRTPATRTSRPRATG